MNDEKRRNIKRKEQKGEEKLKRGRDKEENEKERSKRKRKMTIIERIKENRNEEDK